MSAIITEKFRQHNANQFVESFTEASASTYYLFLGKATAFSSTTTGGSDSSPPTPGDSPQEEFRAWDSMLGAKIITSSDIKYAVPRRNWANGTVYDMYRHDYTSSNTSTSGSSNLYDSTFYFLTSAYRLYKVLTIMVELHLVVQNRHLNQLHLLKLVVMFLNICLQFQLQTLQSMEQQILFQ